MITVDEFRERIRNGELDGLMDEVLLGDGAAHLTKNEIEHIRSSIASKFRIKGELPSVWIVGSAKLGFAITEKRRKDGLWLPRYRPFSGRSDIDIAVVCPTLFDLLWNELGSHAHRHPRLPWDSGKLGDYLVCGWIRPDWFPLRVRLRNCDDWWDLFRSFSADVRFGRRKVRGGLFYSFEHLKRYHTRALKECSDAENLLL
jgi:hypothetical protein